MFFFLGIDVLSSGYDAASWTSKYKIFDFSQEGDTIHVPSINKTYTAPAMVNVVTDGMNSKRVEDSCLDVVTHFEGIYMLNTPLQTLKIHKCEIMIDLSSFLEYFHMYQRSTSFDVGVSNDDFKLGFSYHKDVEEIYYSITSTGQAIGNTYFVCTNFELGVYLYYYLLGVSEAWWGMYEVTAPPAFLLTSKLDPFFLQSKQYLATIGTPKSEAEQIIYNQVCCGPSGFGTHYVGSIIVGARATITTFVNSSFHSEYSHKTVSEQVRKYHL